MLAMLEVRPILGMFFHILFQRDAFSTREGGKEATL